eukprot:1160997-Pelagomonas_calceolata.AAC.5
MGLGRSLSAGMGRCFEHPLLILYFVPPCPALGKIEVDSAMSLPNSVLCLSFPAPPYWAHSAQQGRHGLLQGARKACFLCL